MTKGPLKTFKNSQGLEIYVAFDFRDNIADLDKEIIQNTLSFNYRMAELSDDYNRTMQEQDEIEWYAKAHNIQIKK